MSTWWNRLASRVRGHASWTTPSIGPNGAIALLADPPIAARMTKTSNANDRVGALAWLRSQLSLVRTSSRAQLQDAITNLAHVCEMIGQNLERQQLRLDEIATAVRKLAGDLAGLPSATMEHKRQVELLSETVTAHRNETVQLGALMADVPAALRPHRRRLSAADA